MGVSIERKVVMMSTSERNPKNGLTPAHLFVGFWQSGKHQSSYNLLQISMLTSSLRNTGTD